VGREANVLPGAMGLTPVLSVVEVAEVGRGRMCRVVGGGGQGRVGLDGE